MKKLLTLLMLLVFTGPAWSADEWLKTRPALTGDQWTAWPAASQANNNSLDRLLANYRQGMVLAYSSATTVTVSAGEVMCSNSDGSVRKMRQNTSATNVTFSDLDAGSEAPSTTYYIYANCDADATTATFKISASSTAPTGITHFKRLGSFYNDSSSNVTTTDINNDNNIYSSRYGAWTTKSVGTIYQATTDGVAVLVTTGGGDRDHWIYSDSSSSPSTARCRFNTYPDGSENNSCNTHVKKGDYYQANYSGGAGSPVLYWLPTGN